MRRVPRGTFARIVDRETLWAAYRRARRGKRSSPEVAMFEVDLEYHLAGLRRSLTRGRYRPRPYRVRLIRDPKLRPIVLAAFSDRVVHQALHGVVAPYFDRSFIDHTYACLANRGTHRAVLRFLTSMRRCRYHLSLDIHRFFPSIAHDRLLQLLLPPLRDRSLVQLVEVIIKSAEGLYRREDLLQALPGWAVDPPAPNAGLPIGTLTSQWWANGFLSGADHFIKRELKIGWYQRYMDNLDLFHDDPAVLASARTGIEDWLWRERGLRLNPKSGEIRSTRQPTVYLGYRVSRAGLAMGPVARRRMKARLRQVRNRDDVDVTAMLQAYRAMAEFG